MCVCIALNDMYGVCLYVQRMHIGMCRQTMRVYICAYMCACRYVHVSVAAFVYVCVAVYVYNYVQ